MSWQHGLPALVLALAPLGFVAVPAEPADDVAQIEKGLFRDPKGPRWTIQERMTHHKVPGVSLAVIRARAVAWAKGYGTARAGEKVPVGVDLLFQAASMSKPLAALLALLLADQGQLDLDEDVNKYLKRWQVPVNAFTQKQKVTVRELVSHTAGVNVSGFPGYADGQPLPTLLQVLKGEPPANTPAITVTLTPGQQHRYSGGGYCILQMLIEDVTGKDFAEAARTMVLDPLGMKHSHFHVPGKAGIGYAAGHAPGGSVIAGQRHVYPEAAAAGLYTTPREYAHFGILYMNKGKVGDRQLLAAKWVDEILRGQGPGRPMGLGVALFPGGFAHNGANAGFRCSALFFPATGDGVIVMTNSDNGSALFPEIIKSVRATYGF